MQSSNPLLALGVGAVVAASAIGISPAAAESGLVRRQPSPPEGTASPSAAESSSVQDSASDHPVTQNPDAQDRIEQRFDRLQMQNEVQQQLNQSQFQLNPGVSGANSLQLEQEVQQQINLQELQNLRRDAGITPSDGLDRLQYEQRVRQQLQQPNPNSPQSKVTLAQANGTAAAVENSETAEAETTNPEAVSSEAIDSAKSETPAESSETPEVAEAEPTKPESVEAAATSAEPAETSEAQSAQSETAAVVEAAEPSESGETPKAETATPATSASSATPEIPAPAPAETPEASKETEPAEFPESTPEASEDDSKERSETTAQADESTDRPRTQSERPSRTTEQAEDRIDRQNRDYPNNPEAPAPEYLDPDANPLSFPTQPDEVDLVGTQPITLQQAIQLAIRNNPTLQQERLQLERTQAALREAEASNYPTLDATASFNQQGQQAFQEEVDQLAPTGDPQQPLTTVTVPSDTNYRDSTALGANLEVSYPIYTSGRRSALIRSSQGQVRLQQLEVERQTEELILNTTDNYYDLQQASAQVNIFRANLAEAEQSLQDAQALERAGVGTRFDVLQAEVDVANARQELTQQLSQLEIARRQLAQRLSLAESINLEAADVIEVSGVWDLSLPETVVQAYKNRAELEQQLIQREIAQQNRRAALAQLGPQLAFNGSFGFTNDLDRDPGFLYNYQLGLTASLSLYDGGEARAQANQQESNISIAEAEFQNQRDQIRFQVEQAYYQLDSNFDNIQTTALAVEQATEALRLARLRFQAGVGTQTDVLRQQTALAQAQVNNLQAILDYNRALATLQRQVSNYPEGLLNEQP